VFFKNIFYCPLKTITVSASFWTECPFKTRMGVRFHQNIHLALEPYNIILASGYILSIFSFNSSRAFFSLFLRSILVIFFRTDTSNLIWEFLFNSIITHKNLLLDLRSIIPRQSTYWSLSDIETNSGWSN